MLAGAVQIVQNASHVLIVSMVHVTITRSNVNASANIMVQHVTNQPAAKDVIRKMYENHI